MSQNPKDSDEHSSPEERRKTNVFNDTTSLNIRTVDVQRAIAPEKIDLKEPSVDARLGHKPIEDQRFAYISKLGQGATANVFELVDHNTRREVAVKTPKEVGPAEYRAEMNRFIEEAKVAAKLEHPAIVPVYELNVDDNGRLYMCMRRVQGHSLRNYIDAAAKGEADPYVRTVDDLILVFIKVCDALAYAHSQGCIHQDIKPDNILIGEYGQVFLIDWGASAAINGEMALTPAYMSPQQAMTQPPKPTDDVYCLGATLFHCLTQRFVVDAPELDQLWEKKKHGEIDPLTAEETAKAPARLLAIAMKAIEPKEAGRYRSVREFGQDLKNLRAGVAVRAYREPLLFTIARLTHRYRYGLGVLLSILLASAIAFGFFHQLRQKEIAYWSAPVFSESFSDESWTNNWIIYKGSAVVENGRLVTDGKEVILFHKNRLYGSTAIEFEAEMLPGAPPGDLSVIWSDDLKWNRDHTKITHMGNHFRIQTGAWWNTFSGIVQRGKGLAWEGACLDYSNFRLQNGNVYKIRAEIDGHWIRLFVDGRLLCSHEALFPQQSGYIAIYGFLRGKAFDNVRIYSKGVPQMTTATEVGDAFLQRGLYDKAAAHYKSISQSRAGKHVIQEARYKYGLCLWQLGHRAGAYRAWNGLEHTPFAGRISYHRVADLYAQNKPDLALALLGTEYTRTSRLGQRMLRELWSLNTAKLTRARRKGLVEQSLAVREKYFPKDRTHTLSAASALLMLGRYDEIETKCPNQHWAVALALRKQGRFQEVLERYSHMHDQAAAALLEMGREEELIARYPNQTVERRKALLRLGRYDDLVRHPGPLTSPEEIAAMIDLNRIEDALHQTTAPRLVAKLLLAAGKADQVLTRFGKSQPDCIEALFALNRQAEVLKRYPHNRAACARALFALGRYNDVAEGYLDQPLWNCRAMIRLGQAEDAVLRHAEDDEACALALAYLGRHEEILQRFPQRRDLCARALLALGRHEQLLNKYPDQRFACAIALLRKGAPDRVLQRYRDQREACMMAMCQTGNPAQAAERYYMVRPLNSMLLIQQGLYEKAIEANPHSRIIRQTIAAQMAIDDCAKGKLAAGENLSTSQLPFARDVVGPFVAWLREPKTSFAEHSGFLKRPDNGLSWQTAAFIPGHIKENEFHSATIYHNAELLLAKAIRAEVRGQPARARGLYAGYLRLLTGERPINPLANRFASWRIVATRDQ